MSGFVIWMTGLSGAGKSTLAALLNQALVERGIHVECLDGDEVRKNLSHGLGFSREDRDRNVRRVGYVARMVARSGACAITASISPYRALRDEIRSKTDNFVEVYCECPLDVLTARDPKGLYKKALAGEIKNFTGIDDPYEAPEDPDVRVRTDKSDPQDCLNQILKVLEERGMFRQRRALRSLPGAIGGEVYEARRVGIEEWSSVSHKVAVEPGLAEQVSAVGSGYWSPLAGFMSQREATKVAKSSELERGTPWWSEAFLLPWPDDEKSPENGEEVALAVHERPLGIMRVEEVWKSEGRVYLSGPLEALVEGSYLNPTARQFRRQAEELGWSRLACLLASKSPDAASLSKIDFALTLTDAIVVAVGMPHFDAWSAKLEPLGVSCLAVPSSFPLADEQAQVVLRRSIGASSSCLID